MERENPSIESIRLGSLGADESLLITTSSGARYQVRIAKSQKELAEALRELDEKPAAPLYQRLIESEWIPTKFDPLNPPILYIKEAVGITMVELSIDLQGIDKQIELGQPLFQVDTLLGTSPARSIEIITSPPKSEPTTPEIQGQVEETSVQAERVRASI